MTEVPASLLIQLHSGILEVCLVSELIQYFFKETPPKYRLPHLYFRKRVCCALWQMPAGLVKSRLTSKSVLGNKLASLYKIYAVLITAPATQDMAAARTETG